MRKDKLAAAAHDANFRCRPHPVIRCANKVTEVGCLQPVTFALLKAQAERDLASFRFFDASTVEFATTFLKFSRTIFFSLSSQEETPLR